MSTRAEVVRLVADDVRSLATAHVRRVAVDGVDGAGKTYFADELAQELVRTRVPVIRASVDGFHNPPELRHRRGRYSPEGFFVDSYDYDRLTALLLDPLSPAKSGDYVQRVYDVHAEREVECPVQKAAPGSVLLLDGIFLHRDELAGYWDYSVWLDVPFTVSVPRGAGRGYGDADPQAPVNRRYVGGQRLYLAMCRPQTRATVVIDNEHLDRPLLRRNNASR